MTSAPAGRAGAGPYATTRATTRPTAGRTARRPDSWPVILSGRRGRLLAGLVLTELAVAVQILIVVTVLPAVERQLGGIRLYGLALSAAALAGIGTAPAAVRLLDRFGGRVVVPAGVLVFGCGALGAGLARSMAMLVAARLIEGAGAAALGAIALGSIAVLYDQAQRPKVMVLGNVAWALPSVGGPALGALAVATVGWRWAFTATLPLLAGAMVLVAPGLGLLRPAGGRPEHGTPEHGVAGPSMLLAAGLLAVLGGLAAGGAAGFAAAGVGACAAAAAAWSVMPSGMLLLRRGRPAVTMAVFCCSFAFFAVDGFVPLLLTAVDARSVSAAGVVVTLAVLCWTAGGMAQARLSRQGWRPARLVATGSVLILSGIGGTALGLIPGAWLAPYLAWAVGGFGMGLASTGVWLAAMAARPGEGAGEGDVDGTRDGSAPALAAPLVADRAGTALGAGVGGVCVAVATASGLGVGTGIGLGLVVAAAGACVLMASSRRIG
jgi:MFS family permease